MSLALDPLLGQGVAPDAPHAGSPRSEIDMTCIHRQDDFDAEMAAVEALFSLPEPFSANAVAAEPEPATEPEPESEPEPATKASDLRAQLEELEQKKAACAQAKQFREAGQLKKEIEKVQSLLREKEALGEQAEEQKQEEAAGAQALPDGWEKLASPSYPGRYFYSHAATGKSQWEVPQ